MLEEWWVGGQGSVHSTPSPYVVLAERVLLPLQGILSPFLTMGLEGCNTKEQGK